MAGWSITHKEPSTAPDASIDSSTGVASFLANTSTTTDNVYTITYDAGNGCTQSTTYTIPKCVPSCTYTVKSDVTGATVHWYVSYTVGDTVIYTDYGYGTTDSNGTASISASESNKMRASLSKTGITFDDNNGKEINCNGEITINGEEDCGEDIAVNIRIEFENQPLIYDKLNYSFVCSVGGAEFKYEKCDGTEATVTLARIFGVNTFINFHKEDIDEDGYSGTKTSKIKQVIDDFKSFKEITNFGSYISFAASFNDFSTQCGSWGGDFQNLETKIDGQSYQYRCYATCDANDILDVKVEGQYIDTDKTLYITYAFKDLIVNYSDC